MDHLIDSLPQDLPASILKKTMGRRMRPEGNPSRSASVSNAQGTGYWILDRLQERRWASEKFELVHCSVEIDESITHGKGFLRKGVGSIPGILFYSALFTLFTLHRTEYLRSRYEYTVMHT